jgi:protein gp37
VSEHSDITWTDGTFNPWWGCTKVSPGCTNCYAAAFDKRVGGNHWKPTDEHPNGERRFFGEKHWREPLKWNARAERDGKRMRVFCASMADVFEDHADLPAERAKLWPLIESTPWLDWLLLTKRPENIRAMVPWPHREPPPNVWLGATVENAEYAWRVDELRKVKAAVRFISYEPALGPIADAVDLTGIDWIVAGDESGARRRPAEVQWFADLRDKCERDGVAFHLKQWAGAPDVRIDGERSKGAAGKIHLPILDGRQHAAFPVPR